MININDYVMHESGLKGKVIKKYKPTGRDITIQILLNDGRIYYAPINEFIKLFQ